MSRRSNVLPSLALALLLGASILAVQPADAFPVSAAQAGAVVNQFGDGAPFSGWEVRSTPTRLWYTSDPTGVPPAPGTPAPFYSDGTALVNATLQSDSAPGSSTAPEHVAATPGVVSADARVARIEARASVQGQTADPGISARFPIPEGLIPVDSMQLYRIEAKMLAGCDASGVDPSFLGAAAQVAGLNGIQQRLVIQKKVDTAWQDDRVAATTLLVPDGYIWATDANAKAPGQSPFAVQMYRGSSTLGSLATSGYALAAGERVVAEYRPQVATGTPVGFVCFLYYGTQYESDSSILSTRREYSEMTLTADSARLAVLTQDEEGRHVTGFPSGVPGRLHVVALYASAWGSAIAPQLIEQRHANVRLYDVAAAKFLYFVDNSAGGFPREYDTQVMKLVSSRSDNLVPEPDVEEHLAPAIIKRDYLFSYPATLPETLAVEPQFYSFSDGWELRAAPFAIGGKGIEVTLLDGESALHRVLPLEPTQFTFVVRNIGTSDELVSVSATEPGDGWTATVLGGGQFFVRPGGQAVGAVEVVPPQSAGAGTTKAITLRASAASDDVEDPDPIAVQVQVTNDLVRDVDLAGPLAGVVVRPGLAKSFPATITNNGTARDSFVILPSVPANMQGWTVSVTPPSLQMVAGQRAQLQVTVTAPPEALSGSAFTLGLTAVEVGDSTVSERIDVAIQVLSVVGLDVSVLDASRERNLRENAPDSCVDAIVDPLCLQSAAGGTPAGTPPTAGTPYVDQDYDWSALFRIPITNNGDKAEAFRVEAVWNRTIDGFTDDDDCDLDSDNDSSGDGVPDGWRYRWQGDVAGGAMPESQPYGLGQADPFAGRYQLQGLDSPLLVPARTTVWTFLEIGHVEVGCSYLDGDLLVGVDYSSAAGMLVTVSSISDPTLSETVKTAVRITPHGSFEGQDTYSGQQNRVGMTRDNGVPDMLPAPLGDTATFAMRAFNAGNEQDDLVIRVSGTEGWTHTLTRTVTSSNPGSVPAGIACDGAGGTSMRCINVGVYDEVKFNVVARPPADARPGARDDVTVTVASGDSGNVSQAHQLTVRAAGTFEFAAGPLGNATREGNPGRTVALPFFVDNQGTEADTFVATLTVSDPKWNAVLSTGPGMFLPALHGGAGYVSVTIPSDATLNQAKQFRVQVVSAGGQQTKVFDLFARPVATTRLALAGADGPDVLIPSRGVPFPVDIDAILLTGDEVPVTVAVDTRSLPDGWTVSPTPASRTLDLAPDANGRPAGTTRFTVTAPAEALGTTRAILRVVGSSSSESTLKATTDITLNLASTFGLELNGTALNQTIAPGGDAIYDMRIANRGLGTDAVLFTHTALPTGWTMLVNPGSVSLGPLEEKNFTVKLSAPASAEPKAVASFVLFAASTGDPTTLDSVPLRATVGYNELRAQLTTPVAYGSPQETLVYVVNVTNTGTLPDLVKVGSAIDPPVLSRHIAGNVTPAQFEVLPGQTVQVRFDQKLDDRIPSGAIINGTAIFTSLLDERPTPASARAATEGHVLRYALADLNGDTVVEYAVDRDRDPANGFEQFQASTTPGAVGLAVPDLQKFLRDDARESFSRDIAGPDGTVQRVLVYTIDGDGDGKIDHFLDRDGDDQPDIYWDPDANKASPIEFRKDINGDQVPESFVDTDGDGEQDAVFDLTRGTFIDVIKIDVDGDCQLKDEAGKPLKTSAECLDYVIDKDGDGEVDSDETVLYTRTGGLLIVQKVDVDGDDRLDQVFDTDGDGSPDYFIPAGSDDSVEISMRDVNGDGTQDWTFDGDGDGRKESYYDPVTGEAHVIDAAGHFGDALVKYWYVGALFALVLVLFVALVLVTRR